MDYSLLIGIHDIDRAEQELNDSVESEENGVEEDEDSTGSGGAGGGIPTPPDSPLCPNAPPAFTGDIDPSFEIFALKCSDGAHGWCSNCCLYLGFESIFISHRFLCADSLLICSQVWVTYTLLWFCEPFL